jgi:uncharacterized protein (TIGR02246 family)
MCRVTLKFILIAILIGCLFGCNQNDKHMIESDKALEIEKIVQVMDAYVVHWNNNDMDSWGNLFTDDVDYINRNGGWWKNNKDNIAGHKQIHTMLLEMGQPKTYGLEIQKIEFLNPDIAIVQALSSWPGFKHYSTGEPVDNIKGIMTCVFVKVEGEWLIKTLHNTLKDTHTMHKAGDAPVGEKIKAALIKADVDGDWGDFMDLMHKNVTFQATIAEGTPISGVFRGKSAVTAYFEVVLPAVATFSQNKPMEFIIDHNKIIVLGDDTYTTLKNNKSHRSPYAMVIESKEDKISSILIVQDLTGIYQAYTSD